LYQDRACEREFLPSAIFGSPDDFKFRSCVTLFSLAIDNPDNPFPYALDRWCSGRPDEQTLAVIDAGG
jgi:uncharacterized protein (DUF1810 family)